MRSHSHLLPVSGWAALLLALLVMMVVMCKPTHVNASASTSLVHADTESDAASASSADTEIDPAVVASAMEEIKKQLATSTRLNNQGGLPIHTELALDANSKEAKELTIQAEKPEQHAFAFLAEAETPISSPLEPALRSADVESTLALIQSNINSLFNPTSNQQPTATMGHQQPNASGRRMPMRARRMSAQRQQMARNRSPQAAGQHRFAAQPNRRLDAYGTQRAQTEPGDISVLESGARATNDGTGYSIPQPFQPLPEATPSPVAPIAPFGFPTVPGVPASIPTLNEVGSLLSALKKVQQEQETAQLAKVLAASLGAGAVNGGAPAYPVGVAFNGLLPQQGLVNPAAPWNGYPAFIPANQASVGQN